MASNPLPEAPHLPTAASSAAPAAPAVLTWRDLGPLLRAWPGSSWAERRQLLGRGWRGLASSSAWLELHHQGQVQRLPVGLERLRIGRDPVCELVVDAEGVSRVHAVVEHERPGDRDPCLEDFNSANGVFWRDRRIRALGLRHGDRVQLGSPLKGAPILQYHHPRSALERLGQVVGLTALAGSALAIGGLMVLSSISGGSRVRFIGGPVKIVSEQGRQIDPREGAATPLPRLEDYPLHLRQALVASEDSRFGWNSGLDVFGTLRSLVLRSGGGSGLTQQVARLYYPWVRDGDPQSPWPWVRLKEDEANPTRAQVFARKLRELPVSWQLETSFSKNQILKMYLDRAYLGLGTHGFEQAAQLYFRKSARQLNLAESAYLVGLLPSPNGYNVCAPTPQQERAARLELEQKTGRSLTPGPEETTWTPKLRRDLVLRRMLADGYISGDQYRDALRSPLLADRSVCQESTYQSYPFFSDYVMWELEGPRYALNLNEEKEGGNYHVVSTIDVRLQDLAQRLLRQFLEKQAKPLGVNQAALISLDVRSGAILAYVGGGDYRFDRVQALRQPGSTFKLFTYLAALEKGYSSHELISCAPLYQLESGCHHGAGSLSMSDGLTYSENPIAIRLADAVGFDTVIRMALRLGISSDKLRPDPSMVLGGNEVLLYEMARAYAVVANGGRTVPMHGVSRIYDLGVCGSALSLATCPSRGIFEPIGEKPQQLIAAPVAAAMDGMLQRVVQEGTGRNAAVVADARGKTGTTNNGVDVWFIGYSPSRGILTGIWMGNDDNRPAEAASSALAAQLWGEFMRQV